MVTKSMSILSDNYIIINKLGSGSFGEVYLAQRKDGLQVAAKVEDRSKVSRIINEYKIYKYLAKNGFEKGLPKVYELIQTKDYNIMFMQLLGLSLDDIFNKNNKKFDLKQVLYLGIEILKLIKSLHTAEFIHRDIKPSNFMVGVNNDKQLYILDLGLSKKYVKDKKHIEYRDGRSLIGTARYASINMHLGIEPSRRDDLESIGYMLVYFLKGVLPWQGLKKKGVHKNIEAIGEIKIAISIDSLCENLPECFHKYITYCRNLKFDETPDYDYMSDLFIKTAENNNYSPLSFI